MLKKTTNSITKNKKDSQHLNLDHEVLTILSDEARKLRETMEKTQSPGRRFLIGVLAGIGSAIGATIIAAFLLFWLAKIFTNLGIENVVPGLNVITEQSNPARQSLDLGQ